VRLRTVGPLRLTTPFPCQLSPLLHSKDTTLRETHMRILIVEDEFLIAMDIEDIVRTLGHEVVGPGGSLPQAMELGAKSRRGACRRPA